MVKNSKLSLIITLAFIGVVGALSFGSNANAEETQSSEEIVLVDDSGTVYLEGDLIDSTFSPAKNDGQPTPRATLRKWVSATYSYSNPWTAPQTRWYSYYDGRITWSGLISKNSNWVKSGSVYRVPYAGNVNGRWGR